jgi:hypothetical protein
VHHSIDMQFANKSEVMSHVSVPQLSISAPESTAVKLNSVKRKMSSMESVIDLLHREMETLRTIIDASS